VSIISYDECYKQNQNHTAPPRLIIREATNQNSSRNYGQKSAQRKNSITMADQRAFGFFADFLCIIKTNFTT
jgi:hypothetical protein